MDTSLLPSYTWSPDLPDFHDQPYVRTSTELPAHVDLRPNMPPIFSQGRLGSCTANALAGQLGFLHPGSEAFSRLFIYYGERSLEGSITRDSGAQLRDGIKFLASSGCCYESIWPYNTAKFTVKPLAEAYTAAQAHKIISYTRLTSLDDMMDCLASGFPFVFGFTVYESFETPAVAKTGILGMPVPGERPLGGHAVEAVGYDMASKRLIVRNSWGAGWGQSGHFTMPFDYVINRGLSDDFWTIRK